MVSKERKQILISKEEAVFWMDKNGTWHNEHGKFEHPRIIKYFNASIRKDENGYYVHQVTDDHEEKVYFPYEDTALFVIDIKEKDDILLTLNNNETLKLDGEQLFVRDDNLYLQTPEHTVKFGSRALLKMSKFMQEKDGQLSLIINGRCYPVQ
ncbi:MFS transporter permease [Desulfobacula sp.]|uniref:MFS transporter permease n=1 Tax=Desulfobacula sp. TaxID=2593537 RepID=UPI00262A752A|nr:MFS transporter permease [Desulfobacula sp.]